VNDLRGRRFSYLTVLKFIGVRGKNAWWRTRCVCGSDFDVQGAQLTRGDKPTKSCGCKTAEIVGAANRTHGMSRHPTFAVWRSMNDRCRLPTHQAWHNYGARGIRVCERWQESFENFWEDMGPTYAAGLTLDRRDNDKNYTKRNCRWVTPEVQGNNRRGNIRIPTPWGLLTVAQASRRSGVGDTTILYRIKQGWPEHELLKSTTSKTPVRDDDLSFLE
jgi:hypothetical protein